MVAIAARRERCARCGQVISRRQVPSVWHNHIVCGRCHSKLRALEPAMALSKAVQPDLGNLPGTLMPMPNLINLRASVLGRCVVTAMKRTFHFAK